MYVDETKEIISELAHGILEVAHRWFEVGTLIGVPLMKLEIIAGKHFNSEEEKLQELIEVSYNTVEPSIKDTLKEDKPLNKGQSKSTFVYKQNNLQKEDNLSSVSIVEVLLYLLVKRCMWWLSSEL